MINSKFFDVLKTFSKEDFSRFGEFVNSDYFNKSDMLRKTYSEIQKFSAQIDNEKLTRESLFEAIYPKKPYREATIVNLLSQLYKLCEEFLAVETFRNERYTEKRYTMRGLGKRDLGKFLLKNYTDMQNELDKVKIQDDVNFSNRYALVEDFISYTNNEGPFIETELIQSWHDRFIDFVLIKIMEGYVLMFNHKKFGYEHEFNMSFLNILIDFIKENDFEHAPSILIYFNLMMLLKDDEEQYYRNLKELAGKHPEMLKNSDRWTVYVCLLNFCQLMFDKISSREKYSKELHELYNTIIENEIYKAEAWYPFIHHRLYMNAVQNGLYRKEFEWTENFINKYESELTEEYRASTFNLCYAMYYFSKRDFEKTLQFLNKVQTEDTFYYLHIKVLTLQVFFELHLYDNVISLIDSCRHYLKEKTEIPAQYGLRYRNFLAVVNHLLRIRLGSTKFNETDFDINREEFKNITKIDWLLEKIEELKTQK